MIKAFDFLFSIKTCDEDWIPTFLKENTLFINKLASLESLAIYCNSDDTLLNKQTKGTVIVIKFLSQIL